MKIYMVNIPFHSSSSVDFWSVKYTVLNKNFDTVGKLFLSLCFAIEEGAIFEKKFFTMFFVMFWKQMTVKILVYTVKARLCYSCF